MADESPITMEQMTAPAKNAPPPQTSSPPQPTLTMEQMTAPKKTPPPPPPLPNVSEYGDLGNAWWNTQAEPPPGTSTITVPPMDWPILGSGKTEWGQPEPNTEYSSVLPIARDTKTGNIRFAWPASVIGIGSQGPQYTGGQFKVPGVEMQMDPDTGQAKPVATPLAIAGASLVPGLPLRFGQPPALPPPRRLTWLSFGFAVGPGFSFTTRHFRQRR